MAFGNLEEQIRVLQRKGGEMLTALTGLRADVDAIPPLPPAPLPLQGTTAQRTAAYPLPTTDAARVALANRRIVYFNTELGWSESYYATTGLSGLTARGLVAGTPSGWYPVGTGPRAYMYGPTAKAMVNWTEYDLWATFGTNGSYRRGGAAWFTHVGSRIDIQVPGRYRARLVMTFPNGAGTGVYRFSALHSDNSEIRVIEKPIPLLGSFGQQHEYEMHEMHFVPGDKIYSASTSGTWSCGAGAQIFVEYLGPALVSE